MICFILTVARSSLHAAPRDLLVDEMDRQRCNRLTTQSEQLDAITPFLLLHVESWVGIVSVAIRTHSLRNTKRVVKVAEGEASEVSFRRSTIPRNFGNFVDSTERSIHVDTMDALIVQKHSDSKVTSANFFDFRWIC